MPNRTIPRDSLSLFDILCPHSRYDRCVFSLFLSPEYAPFAVAFVVMLGIGLSSRQSVSGWVISISTRVSMAMPNWMRTACSSGSGLGGGLPLLMWLTSLAVLFHDRWRRGTADRRPPRHGAPLHWGIATAIALVTGGVANIFAAQGLGRILPGLRIERHRCRGTAAPSAARSLRAPRAAVSRPGRRIVDQHDQAHYVMVEPHEDADVIAQGESALLVRKEGQIFFALADASTQFRAV
jgi:hypothetical protein